MNSLSQAELETLVAGGVDDKSNLAYDLAYVGAWVVGVIAGALTNPGSIPQNWHSGTLGMTNSLK